MTWSAVGPSCCLLPRQLPTTTTFIRAPTPPGMRVPSANNTTNTRASPVTKHQHHHIHHGLTVLMAAASVTSASISLPPSPFRHQTNFTGLTIFANKAIPDTQSGQQLSFAKSIENHQIRNITRLDDNKHVFLHFHHGECYFEEVDMRGAWWCWWWWWWWC